MSEVPDAARIAVAPYWFRAKRFGWGWGLPSSWQGWLALAAYLVVLALTQLAFGRGIAAVVAVPATVALLTIALIKGEPPRWRWGADGGR